MQYVRWILFPFSVLYGAATELRNFLFKKSILPSAEFEIPTIVVGNLSVGGSGKTPMVKYLLNLMQVNYRIAVLSRGYGRKSKGFRLVSSNDPVELTGDEPMEIKTAFPDVVVAVCEDRPLGICEILSEHPHIDLIILDDAYQHRYIKGYVNLLLSEYERPYFKDYLMPVGLLRERRKNVDRADAVVFTKSPSKEFSLTPEFTKINKPVFYAHQSYSNIKNISGMEGNLELQVCTVSALAKSKYFLDKINQTYSVKKHFTYPDHFKYGDKEVNKIVDYCRVSGTSLITTSKDWVKLKEFEVMKGIPVFVQEVATQFLDDSFDKWIMNKINEFNG